MLVFRRFRHRIDRSMLGRQIFLTVLSWRRAPHQLRPPPQPATGLLPPHHARQPAGFPSACALAFDISAFAAATIPCACARASTTICSARACAAASAAAASSSAASASASSLGISCACPYQCHGGVGGCLGALVFRQPAPELAWIRQQLQDTDIRPHDPPLCWIVTSGNPRLNDREGERAATRRTVHHSANIPGWIGIVSFGASCQGRQRRVIEYLRRRRRAGLHVCRRVLNGDVSRCRDRHRHAEIGWRDIDVRHHPRSIAGRAGACRNGCADRAIRA
jgi:hypothetical protein